MAIGERSLESGGPATGSAINADNEHTAGADPIDKDIGSPRDYEFASSSDAAGAPRARCIGKLRNGFPDSFRNEFRSPHAVFRDIGDQFMKVAPCTATPRDFQSGTLFQPLFLPGGSENLCDLLHDLLVGNTWGFISERLFDSGAEPFVIACLGLAVSLLERRKSFFVSLYKELFGQPLSLLGGKMPGFIEQSLGVGAHGRIVARPEL